MPLQRVLLATRQPLPPAWTWQLGKLPRPLASSDSKMRPRIQPLQFPKWWVTRQLTQLYWIQQSPHLLQPIQRLSPRKSQPTPLLKQTHQYLFNKCPSKIQQMSQLLSQPIKQLINLLPLWLKRWLPLLQDFNGMLILQSVKQDYLPLILPRVRLLLGLRQII
jgi:hypothetical protein